MVAQIESGKSVRGILLYNENKVEQGKAKLILASGFAIDIDKLDFNQKVQRFRNLTQLNGRVKTNALHISLNFHTDDQLDLPKLQQIASAYMEQIGYGDQPYIAYQHFDAAHPHLHIATTIIGKDGKRKPTHDIGRLISEPARKQIERQFGLIRAEGRKQQSVLTISPAIYGVTPTKQAIGSVVNAVMKNYVFTSLAEFNVLLGQFNVRAERGNENTTMFEKKGLLYSILDKNGNAVGVPIKASRFHSRPTLKNLEKRFLANEAIKKPLKENLRARIGKVLASSPKASVFAAELVKENIALILRRNDTGLIYGATFIDHKQRAVFNGSDLGKAYSAKAITSKFENSEVQHMQPISQNQNLQITNPLEDLLEKPTYDEPTLIGKRKKKKKGIQQNL